MAEVETTAETEGKSILGKAADYVRRNIAVRSDAYSLDTGDIGEAIPVLIPDNIRTTFADVSAIKKYQQSQESDWEKLNLENIFTNNPDKLYIQDDSGFVLLDEKLDKPTDGSTSTYQIAKIAWDKYQNNEEVNAFEQEALDEFTNKVNTINNDIQYKKDQVHIHGYNEDGTINEEQMAGFLWFNPNKALAENRKSLDDFVRLKLGEEDNIVLRRLLRDNFQTGNPLLEGKTRLTDVGTSILDFAFPLKYTVTSDLWRAASQAETASDFFNKWNEGKDNRARLRKSWLKTWENHGVALDHTARFNEWIKDTWVLQGNDESEWESVEEELTLNVDQARSLAEFSTNEMGWLGLSAAFLLENAVMSVGGTRLFKGLRALKRGEKGAGISDIKEYVKLENQKLQWVDEAGIPIFTASSVADFATFLAKDKAYQEAQKLSWKQVLKMPFSPTSLKSSDNVKVSTGIFGKIRQQSRIESGRVRLAEIDDQISPWSTHRTLKQDLTHARTEIIRLRGNPDNLSTNAYKIAVKKAERHLDNVTTSYIRELHKMPIGSKTMTNQQMKAIFGEEVTPAIAQAIAYNLFKDESVMWAETAGAGANILTALGAHRGLIRGMDGLIEKIPSVGDGVYNMKGFLDDWLTDPILSKFGIKKFLDADLRKETIDGAPITKREYNRLYQFQQRLRQLDPSVVDWLSKQNSVVKKIYDDIVVSIEDPKVRNQVADAVKLSFAQMSNITYFAALGRKLMMQMSHSDITKMNGRFRDALDAWMKQEKLIDAQATALNSITEIIGRNPNAFANTAAGKRLTDYQNKLQDALNTFKLQDEETTQFLSTQLDTLQTWLSEPLNWRTVKPDELESILQTAIQGSEVLVPDQLIANVASAAEFLGKEREGVVTAVGSAVKRLDDISMKQFDAAGQLGLIQDLSNAATSNFVLKNILMSQRAENIYKPLENIAHPESGLPIEIPAHSLFTRMLADDIATSGDDVNILARFSRNSNFSQSVEGKSFFKALNNSADRALIKYQLFTDINAGTINPAVIKRLNKIREGQDLEPIPLDTPYENLTGKTVKQLWNIANQMRKDKLGKDIHKINKRWGIEKGDSPSAVQTYLFYRDLFKQTGARELREIGLTLKELEDFRIYARDREYHLKITDPKNTKLEAWKNTGNKITKFIDQEAAKMTVTLPDGSTTDGLSYLEWARTSYEIEIANSKIPGGFHAIFMSQLRENPYSPVRVSDPQQIRYMTKKVNGKTLKFAVPLVKSDKNIVNNALGLTFIKNVFKNTADFEKEAEVLAFRSATVEMWGKPVYPDWAKLENGTLNPDIYSDDFMKELPEYSEWLDEFNEIPKDKRTTTQKRFFINKVRQKLNGDTHKVIDADTELGKEALQFVENAYGLMIKKLFANGEVYTDLTPANIDTLITGDVVSKLNQKLKFSGGDLPQSGYTMNTWLTTTVGGQKELKIAQDFLKIPIIKNGVEKLYQVKNLDAILDSETDLRKILQSSEKAAKNYNIEVDKLNKQINFQRPTMITMAENRDQYRQGFLEFLDVKTPEQFFDRYTGSLEGVSLNDAGAIRHNLKVYTKTMIEDTLERNKMHYEHLKKYGRKNSKGKMVKATQKELAAAKAVTNPETVKEEIFASMRDLLWSGIRRKAKAKPLQVMGMGNKPVTTVAMNDPITAMLLLDRDDITNLFKDFGVDDEHYASMKAITAHMVQVAKYYNDVDGFPSINDPRLTDTGIISRAFNLARGLVSKEYLAVEAGFRIMKDDNLRMMNWLMNDKEGAVLIGKMLDKPDSFTDWNARTLYERMSAWIVREMASRPGRSVANWAAPEDIENEDDPAKINNATE